MLQKNEGLYLNKISVSQLKNIYKQNNYFAYIPKDNYQIPAIFLTRLPEDFSSVIDENERNQLFIQILSPLALKVNETILQERYQLLEIQKLYIKNKKLDDKQILWLEKTAEKYDFFTRLKGQERIERIINKLLERIDVIPPSILIGIAAIETNWGNSRLAQEGNALYREIAWNSKQGLIPEDEKDDFSYRIKQFPSLYESMLSFAIKINSNLNYDSMKVLRADMRYREKTIDGRSLASSFVLYSPKKNFIGLLDYTITFYEMVNIDASKLVYQLPLQIKKADVIKN